MFTSIEGRSVIVTGASRGIGKGIAQVFANKGAQILVVSRNLGPAEATAKDMCGWRQSVRTRGRRV
jgi:3-oxoacyl-[acyl-carrier protein] reductase